MWWIKRVVLSMINALPFVVVVVVRDLSIGGKHLRGGSDRYILPW